jgi:ABC-type multidrug transport system fused ATPase/permease subunit
MTGGKVLNGEVLNVLFAIIVGASSLGGAGPFDASSTEGIKLNEVKGRITFKNVNFAYPTRKDVPILNNFSLEIKKGETVALVVSCFHAKHRQGKNSCRICI